MELTGEVKNFKSEYEEQGFIEGEGGGGTAPTVLSPDPPLLLYNCKRVLFKLFHTYHSHTDVWLVLSVWAQ